MAQTTTVACPACGKQYQVDNAYLGRTFKCTACQTMFQAGGEAAALPELSKEIPLESAVPPAQTNPSQTYVAQGFTHGVQPSTYAVQTSYFDPATQYAPLNYGTQMYQQKTSGMAIASLVCGILMCVPLCSLLAIILGIIGIVQTKPGRDRGRGMAIAGVTLGGVYFLALAAFIVSVSIPAMNKARAVAGTVQSSANMRIIATAIQTYRNQNQMEYPPDLTTLWNANPTLTANNFINYSGTDTPASSPSQLETGGHLSYQYIYPGSGGTKVKAMEVILYETAGNRAGGFTNVLFGSGTVQNIPDSSAKIYIDQSEARAKQ